MKKVILISSIFLFFTSLCFSSVIKVKSPAGGVNWKKGINHTIIWTSSGCQSKDVKINIYKKSSLRGKYVLQLTGKNTGSKGWTIPSNFADGQYVILVKTYPVERGCSGKSGVFTIGTIGTTQSTQPGNIQTQKMRKSGHPNDKLMTVFMKLNVNNPESEHPDLKVTIIPKQKFYLLHQYAQMDFKVENIGKAKSKSTRLKIFQNKKNVDILDIHELNPGEAYKRTKSTLITSLNILISANLDENIKIGDNNKLNNSANCTIKVNAPDLVVASRKYYNGKRGINVKFTAIVKNVGTVRSTPCKLKIYPENKKSSDHEIPALNPGEMVYRTRSATWVLLGSKDISMRIDRFNTNIEENEGNNVVNCVAIIHPLLSGASFGDSSFICSNGKVSMNLDSVWGSGLRQEKTTVGDK